MLIDVDHRVATLYDMVNVPTAVWIDEEGRVVRPNETAFVDDRFSSMSGLRSAPYLAALRDWAVRGDDSPYVLAARSVAARWPGPTEEHRRAFAHFRLARHLHDAGAVDASVEQFERAQSLRPESWNFKRQSWSLTSPDRYGTSWLEEVRKLGDTPYYPRVELDPRPESDG